MLRSGVSRCRFSGLPARAREKASLPSSSGNPWKRLYEATSAPPIEKAGWPCEMTRVRMRSGALLWEAEELEGPLGRGPGARTQALRQHEPVGELRYPCPVLA